GNKRIEYIGAVAVTMVFAGIVIALSYLYEKKRKRSNTYTGVDTETVQDKLSNIDSSHYKILSGATYDRLFVKPWTLVEGAVLLSVLFTLLMGVTKAGWGASTPFGFWFGRLLRVFGVSTDTITSFANKPAGPFTMPFAENPMNMQNIGIVVGTLIYLLMAGMFTKAFTNGLKITPLDALIYAVGGFAMGFGTRLSNGCNVGALYTPIANFSLSGWIFFIALVAGGILGNAILKNVYRACAIKYYLIVTPGAGFLISKTRHEAHRIFKVTSQNCSFERFPIAYSPRAILSLIKRSFKSFSFSVIDTL
ncbi:YeeE/YedE thiosulfate transporter family protein, partial [Treponema socranskii]|uniref:YeeE/YedE thiosulfate transporter family protein n=1 Tax=Treponema socranskii TaxID=53419 RepID=UPI0028E46E4D